MPAIASHQYILLLVLPTLPQKLAYDMAGYGNRNAPDVTASDLEIQHSETRFGRDDSHPYSNPHETYGSGTTGGAGFGT